MCYGLNSVLFVFPDPFSGTLLEARMCRITQVFSDWTLVAIIFCGLCIHTYINRMKHIIH